MILLEYPNGFRDPLPGSMTLREAVALVRELRNQGQDVRFRQVVEEVAEPVARRGGGE